jgi:hypothetical protein
VISTITFQGILRNSLSLVKHFVSKILAKMLGTDMLTDLVNLGTRYCDYLVPKIEAHILGSDS